MPPWAPLVLPCLSPAAGLGERFLSRRVSRPRSGVGAPVIGEIDGEYRHDSRRSLLEWCLPVIDAKNRSGSLEFSIAGQPSDFFPVHVSFISRKNYCNIQVGLWLAAPASRHSRPSRAGGWWLRCGSQGCGPAGRGLGPGVSRIGQHQRAAPVPSASPSLPAALAVPQCLPVTVRALTLNRDPSLGL